jgi:hypothetical protein
MPGTWLGFPFDEEIFLRAWQEEPDPTRLEIIRSGVMVNDPLIAPQLQLDGNFFTIPHYEIIDGVPVNYDGNTDITDEEVTGGYQSGIAYGRAKGFTARNFQAELSGGDPFGHIVTTVGRYWARQRQTTLLKLLATIFDADGATAAITTEWRKHTVDTGEVVGETTFNNAAATALGDNKNIIGLAFMHSGVATTLENKQLLEFWKQTDANGIQRRMNIATINGYLAIIDDDMPFDGTQYTSYLLGAGFLRNASGRLDVPVETFRDPAKNGGQDTLYTRIRETIHPNGFEYKIPTANWTNSPTDAQLFDPAQWTLKFNPKAVPAVAVITNAE